MAAVETVRGPVELDALGVTLMHEHVFVLTPDVMQNHGHEWWDEEYRVADAIAQLGALKNLGVDTIVDPTVIGLGRYLPRVQRVNAQADINIVAATGLYTFDQLPHYFHYRGPGTLLGGPELLTEMFINDITEGIAGTGVKAAFLKQAAPNWHYQHISKDVLPALREQGVTDAQVTMMLVDNPRRYFTLAG
jgi:phosphotriesterase-related protein